MCPKAGRRFLNSNQAKPGNIENVWAPVLQGLIMKKNPNVLLVVIDCLRADRIYGPGCSAQIPHINKAINTGILFSNLITVNSMTTPCMTSMFSGLYPHTHGVRAINYARVSDDIPLLAEIMRDNGYHTYAETTGPVGPFTHLDRGFNHYAKREGVAESFLGKWGEGFIDRFRQGEFSEPWFVYLHLWEVHMPRQVYPKYDAPEFGKSQYDRAISSVDERLGELFSVLENNDLIFITGDHGEKTADSGLEAGVERVKAPFVHMYRTQAA
jgi:arylsulfatase A-like enzyme